MQPEKPEMVFGQPVLFNTFIGINSMSDAGKLRFLADWFDEYDRRNGTVGHDEVQRDLRRMADILDDRE